jgi:GT2 family glycosyltransferase
VIANKYNYGFATAMNQGYRASIGRFLCSFNPDAELFENTLQLSVEYMINHPEVGKIGLATVNHGKLTLPVSQFTRYNTPHFVEMMRSKKSSVSSHDKPFKVDWIFGTGLVIRRSALSVIKLYDEKSFLFWEEYGLSKQIREAGFEMHILPDVKIEHHGSVTFKTNPERIYMARLLSFAHEWRVRAAHYGWWNAMINFCTYTIDNLILTMGLKMKALLLSTDVLRNSELLDRKVRFQAALRILFSSRISIEEINKEATVYFNNGVFPEYPPVTLIWGND